MQHTVIGSWHCRAPHRPGQHFCPAVKKIRTDSGNRYHLIQYPRGSNKTTSLLPFYFQWKYDWMIVFNITFSNIMATSFSGGRSWSTRRQPPTMGKQLVYHLRLRVEWTLFCNLQSWAQTHAVLVIGLYELLGNPTSQLIEPPGPPWKYSFKFSLCKILFIHVYVITWNYSVVLQISDQRT